MPFQQYTGNATGGKIPVVLNPQDAQNSTVYVDIPALIAFIQGTSVQLNQCTATQYIDVHNQVAASTATTTVDLSLGNVITITLSANTTLSFVNVQAGQYLIKIVQAAGGSHTITWPAAVKFSGGTAPTLTLTAGKTDVLNALSDGTSLFCQSFLNY